MVGECDPREKERMSNNISEKELWREEMSTYRERSIKRVNERGVDRIRKKKERKKTR